jgi:hypothetical protein
MTNICLTCIDDDYLEHNCPNSVRTKCDYCGNENIPCLSSESLAVLLNPIASLYTDVNEFMPMEELKELAGNGDFIWDKIRQDWGLFSELDNDALENLFREMFDFNDEKHFPLDAYVDNEREFYGIHYEVADNLLEEWNTFRKEIIYNNRFFLTAFNDVIFSEILSFMEITIPSDTHFFRARIAENKDGFPIKEMGIPPVEKTKSGRANPIGIPYFYLASTAETATAEVRPGVLDAVTICNFQSVEPLRVVDLARTRCISPFKLGEGIQDYILYLKFLDILSSELSKPIHPNKSELEYIPLQYLCEFIKNEGFEGVTYKSSVEKGYNLAAFSDSRFRGISVENAEISNVELTIKH